jgi:hypothetical protein
MSVGQVTAQVLILSLVHLSITSAALGAAQVRTALKERIEQFGIGAEVKVKREKGKAIQGFVESIGEEGFVVVSNDNSAPQDVPFSEVRDVSYPKRGYTAAGSPDPIQAKRMVIQLGVGEHIMVQVSPSQKMRGHIRGIHQNHFVLQPDGEMSTISVPYDSIWKVNKNLSFGATLAILAGIAAAVVLILVLSGEEDIDVLPQ